MTLMHDIDCNSDILRANKNLRVTQRAMDKRLIPGVFSKRGPRG